MQREFETKEYKTDWLASDPIFYNEKTGQVNKNINEVIDFKNLEFHPEGFNNYLDFGYSVFEQTPIKHVKFLRHSSKLTVDSSNLININLLDDPVINWLDSTSKETDVIEQLSSAIGTWEKSVSGQIIIPTSGGYDSRLLNLMVQDKTRIRSFTYGISDNQSESYEVVYAKNISKTLGTQWEQIPLGNFHHYFQEWDNLYGASTHAHGMYHIEFYNKILLKVAGKNPFLSGIIGDAWAGSVKIPLIKSAKPDVIKLGYSHGVAADSSMSRFKSSHELIENYYNIHKDRLISPMYRVVASMRFKIILLSYLLRVPKSIGFQPWSPFLEPHIALSMLTLPEERRKDRIWQKELFKRNNLDLESSTLRVSRKNTLDYQAMRNVKLTPLDKTLLSEVIKPKYLDWINARICSSSFSSMIMQKMLKVPKMGGLISRLGYRDDSLTAYNAYLVLRPIQNLLIKRDNS